MLVRKHPPHPVADSYLFQQVPRCRTMGQTLPSLFWAVTRIPYRMRNQVPRDPPQIDQDGLRKRFVQSAMEGAGKWIVLPDAKRG